MAMSPLLESPVSDLHPADSHPVPNTATALRSMPSVSTLHDEGATDVHSPVSDRGPSPLSQSPLTPGSSEVTTPDLPPDAGTTSMAAAASILRTPTIKLERNGSVASMSSSIYSRDENEGKEMPQQLPVSVQLEMEMGAMFGLGWGMQRVQGLGIGTESEDGLDCDAVASPSLFAGSGVDPSMSSPPPPDTSAAHASPDAALVAPVAPDHVPTSTHYSPATNHTTTLNRLPRSPPVHDHTGLSPAGQARLTAAGMSKSSAAPSRARPATEQMSMAAGVSPKVKESSGLPSLSINSEPKATPIAVPTPTSPTTPRARYRSRASLQPGAAQQLQLSEIQRQRQPQLQTQQRTPLDLQIELLKQAQGQHHQQYYHHPHFLSPELLPAPLQPGRPSNTRSQPRKPPQDVPLIVQAAQRQQLQELEQQKRQQLQPQPQEKPQSRKWFRQSRQPPPQPQPQPQSPPPPQPLPQSQSPTTYVHEQRPQQNPIQQRQWHPKPNVPLIYQMEQRQLQLQQQQQQLPQQQPLQPEKHHKSKHRLQFPRRQSAGGPSASGYTNELDPSKLGQVNPFPRSHSRSPSTPTSENSDQTAHTENTSTSTGSASSQPRKTGRGGAFAAQSLLNVSALPMMRQSMDGHGHGPPQQMAQRPMSKPQTHGPTTLRPISTPGLGVSATASSQRSDPGVAAIANANANQRAKVGISNNAGRGPRVAGNENKIGLTQPRVNMWKQPGQVKPVAEQPGAPSVYRANRQAPVRLMI